MPDSKTQESEKRDLPSLLREISEVAPEIVTLVQEPPEGFDKALYEIRIGDYRKSLWNYPTIHEQRAIIQAALQEAIEEWGWGWNVGSEYKSDSVRRDNNGYSHTAFVSTLEGRHQTYADANDPATALAMAFLKVLRAENA